MMKKFVVSMFLILAFVVVNSGIASAAAEEGKKPASAAQIAQQEKMKNCNKEAKDKGLKGDERKAFMSECLSGKTSAKMSQQDKMKACNQEAAAKALKGDDRKKFMSECLSK